MAAAVLLLHELPDGSKHFDWLIQRAGGPGAPLVSFRVAERIDSGRIARFSAERAADHRAAYLTHEGPVSGGRGTVSRVAAGNLEIVADEPGRFQARGRLGDARGLFSGEAMGDGRWVFGFVDQDESVG